MAQRHKKQHWPWLGTPTEMEEKVESTDRQRWMPEVCGRCFLIASVSCSDLESSFLGIRHAGGSAGGLRGENINRSLREERTPITKKIMVYFPMS